jgi:membrane protein required for colicin V production
MRWSSLYINTGEYMETGINLTGYDFVVIGLFVLLIGSGIWLGLLRQIVGLLSLYLGYFAASHYHDRLFPFLKEISDNPKVVFLIGFVLLFVVTYVVAMLLGKVLAHVIEVTISRWFDMILGGLLGAAKAAIVVVLLHMILGSVLAPQSTILRDCYTCDDLNKATDFARAVIRDEDVRKSLMQQTPAISAEAVRQFLEEPQDVSSAPVE